MLQLLHIENIAVIERADIELDKGLTVLSGETGAGKSIVIDSIGALLGKRVSRDLVRSGAQKGFVSAVFTDLPRALRELLDELALSGDEPDTLYVQRQISAHGCDTVTFEISVNPGEPEKPLSKVASGGELSRIMLALKNVLTAGEDVGMLIFDEIDTGVSGHAAQQIGRKLSAIAKKKQTLCVTHLPQIAAMGDHHLRISKSVRDGRSYTDVSPMDRAHRVDEIARLLSGEGISDAARRNAEELLDAAGQGA